MKKRDLFWVNKILVFLFITLIFGAISLFNIIQFNSSYIQEELEELQVFKRQIEWAINPFLKNRDFAELQKYCDDFKDEDVEFRIFDENKKLLATSNPLNTTKLLDKNSKILNPKYSKFKIYKHSMKDQKIGVREKKYINGHKFYLEITVSQADVMKSILAAQKSSLVFFIVCLLFFIVGLVQVFYTLRNSFNKLEDSVIEFANGNLESEIAIPEIDLLQELGGSVKRMAQRLKTQIARLTQLEQYKTEFLQNITHEIKTPITAINSAIELLDSKNSISEEDRECFEIIQYQSGAINALVNDILNLSEIEVKKTGKNEDFETFSLNKTIEELLGYINLADIKVNFMAENEVKIFANEHLISTAVSNLISNAVRYSNTDKIDIILKETSEEVKLIIKDYGIGISKEHINHIFDKFYRVDKARSRQLGGTGLGLAIVKNIVELHNGEITLESDVNKGCNFRINLPKK